MVPEVPIPGQDHFRDLAPGHDHDRDRVHGENPDHPGLVPSRQDPAPGPTAHTDGPGRDQGHVIVETDILEALQSLYFTTIVLLVVYLNLVRN